jgi:hypothetical protein
VTLPIRHNLNTRVSISGVEAGTLQSHGHGYVRLRLPLLAGLLASLHLPFGWLVESGDLPHHPECTPTEGVVEQ